MLSDNQDLYYINSTHYTMRIVISMYNHTVIALTRTCQVCQVFPLKLNRNFYCIGTHTTLTKTPQAAVISIVSASISKSLWIIRLMARYTKTPVSTQIISTELTAPIT